MKEIYLLVDAESHEMTEVLAAYTDRAMAERRLTRMKRKLDAWRQRQKDLDADGSDEAYSSNPPHHCSDLQIWLVDLIERKVTKGKRS